MGTPTPDEDDTGSTLTPDEVATILGVSSRSVIRWADDGVLPLAFRTAGGHRRFRRDAIERFRATRDARAAPHDTK